MLQKPRLIVYLILTASMMVSIYGIAIASGKQSDETGTSKSVPVEGWQLSAKADPKNLVAGGKINLDLTVTNMSEDTKSFTDIFSVEYQFELKVTDSDGEPVNLTPKGRTRQTNPPWGHIYVIPFKPDQTKKYVRTVSEEYDLTKPGVYFVTVSYRLHDDDKGHIVRLVSNTVNLLVRQPTTK